MKRNELIKVFMFIQIEKQNYTEIVQCCKGESTNPNTRRLSNHGSFSDKIKPTLIQCMLFPEKNKQ